MKLELFKCLNTMCRIETFTGVRLTTLNVCPLCQATASLLFGTTTSSKVEISNA